MQSNEIIPLFYDHSSRKSSLTFWKADECEKDGPKSIVTLCKEAKLDKCVFVSTDFHTYFEAFNNLSKENIQLIFGLQLWITQDVKDRSETSIKNESKVIVFMKNESAYKDLLKLHNSIFTDINNKYYKFRGDWKILNDNWTDNLSLYIPMFDSFLDKNHLSYGAAIIPYFPVEPKFFIECNTEHPKGEILTNIVKDFGGEIVNSKTIYYDKYEDFKAYCVYRTILNRSTFNSPNLEYFCSNTFCFEDYLCLLAKT